MSRLIDADKVIERINGTGYAEQIKSNLRFMVDMQPTIGGWIPCSERLPNYREVVLISGFGDVKVAARDAVKEDGTDDFWDLLLDDATRHPRYVDAWMPLPEPYKEERR